MGHRHIAEQHYREQITRKIAKRAAVTASNVIEKCNGDSSSVDVLPIEQPSNLGSVNHEQAKEIPKAETASNASSVCRFCGITTNRVKAHERQCQRSRTSLTVSGVTTSSEPT